MYGGHQYNGSSMYECNQPPHTLNYGHMETTAPHFGYGYDPRQAYPSAHGYNNDPYANYMLPPTTNNYDSNRTNEMYANYQQSAYGCDYEQAIIKPDLDSSSSSDFNLNASYGMESSPTDDACSEDFNVHPVTVKGDVRNDGLLQANDKPNRNDSTVTSKFMQFLLASNQILIVFCFSSKTRGPTSDIFAQRASQKWQTSMQAQTTHSVFAGAGIGIGTSLPVTAIFVGSRA